MTFGDLLYSARRYWKFVVVGIVICTLIGLGYGMLRKGTYKATSMVTSSVDIAALKGQAEAVAQRQSGAKISVTADTTSKTIKATGEGKNARDVVVGVNEVAKETAKAATSMVATAAVDTSPARQASYTKKSPFLFAAAGFAGGVLLTLAILVLVTERKAPVYSVRELEESTELPVLGTLPAKDEGALLAANVTFSAGDAPESVCLVPAGTVDTAEAAEMLKKSFARSGAEASPRVIACKSISESVDTAYEANKASVTVLAVAEWNDSLKDVERALHELALAKANLVGIVFVTI